MTTAIDLFAGLGGFTEGASLAGVRVLWAANHAPAAVATHAANHPETTHVCQDLHQADWTQVPAHDILLASPCCQGHTRARGKDRPHHDASRSTAWAVVSAAEYHRPEACIIENVSEFLAWALYPAWADAMGRLGYALALHILDAADHGVPQHRRRLVIVATRSREPLRLTFMKRPHRPACEVIRWDDYTWSTIGRPGRSAATLARIARARRDLGTDTFLVPYYGSGSGLTGRSLGRPLGTVTTLDRWAIIRGEQMRMLQPAELRAAMGFRDDYILPANRRTAIYQLGNAVCPPKAADAITAVLAAA